MLTIVTKSIVQFLLTFPNFVLIGTFFGFCSALTAYCFGDKRLKKEGYLSFNPFSYQDVTNIAIFLGVMLLAINTFGNGAITSMIFFGLIMSGLSTLKSVPISSHSFKHPVLHEVLALLAGPIGAFFYSFILMLGMRLLPFSPLAVMTHGSWQNLAWLFIDEGSTIGIFIGVLTLIPLLPQTGGRITLLLIPDEYEDVKELYATYGMMIFLALLIIPGLHGSFTNLLLTITQGIKIMLHKIVFFDVL